MPQKRGVGRAQWENYYSRHVNMYNEMSYLLTLTLGGVRGRICELFLLVIAAGKINDQTAQKQQEETNGYQEDRRTSQQIH